MEIREAVEADAERMADIADSPPDVMRNLVHDRTVRVAEETESGGPSATGEGENEAGSEKADDESAHGPEVEGLVSFDAREGTVHVTQFAGTPTACTRLIDEPIRFARGEGMSVELLVSETDDEVREAVEGAGFQRSGSGPRFEGQQTTRYRLEPGKAEQ